MLDAFCGGGTTPAVARRLGQKFIAIDQSKKAIAQIKFRLLTQNNTPDYDIILYDSKIAA